jgi:selenocysteine lyase/cysteine desulfurase
LDLKRLADHCQSVGAVLAVDAIQGIGQLPFSFAETGVDFVASGSHKWMCGPTGQAFFAIRPELMAQLELQAVGGGTFGRFGTFADVASPMEATAKRFEAGGYNFVSLAALSAAIKVIQSVGVATIAQEISRLTALLRAGLRELGVTLATPMDQVGGHTSFELSVESEAKLIVRAREERIAIAKRGKYIRTSIHAYCSDRDVDHFLGVLGGCR